MVVGADSLGSEIPQTRALSASRHRHETNMRVLAVDIPTLPIAAGSERKLLRPLLPSNRSPCQSRAQHRPTVRCCLSYQQCRTVALSPVTPLTPAELNV